MKTYKEETVTETRTRKVLVKRCCDLCGREAKSGDDWERGLYEVSETEVEMTVRHKVGDNFPSGGSGTEFIVDLCPVCFTGKLIPWLKSQGAQIEERDWWW